MKNSLSKASRFIICGVIYALAWCFPAYADVNSSDKWEFQIAPYAWLAGQKGTVATLPGLPAADIKVDFYDDILGNINFAGMLAGEARKGHFGMFMDIMYTDIEAEDSTPLGIYYSSVTSQTKSWVVSGAGLYRLFENQRQFLDAIGGIRYWSVDTDLTLEAGLFPKRKISNDESWVDPIIGLKGLSPLGNSKFFISGTLVIGGFGVGSDFMWDANINLGYQWTQGFSTIVGYRYLDVDYEKDDFLYDVAQDGLVLGLSWRF